jgi:hypothetical protein
MARRDLNEYEILETGYGRGNGHGGGGGGGSNGIPRGFTASRYSSIKVTVPGLIAVILCPDSINLSHDL